MLDAKDLIYEGIATRTALTLRFPWSRRRQRPDLRRDCDPDREDDTVLPTAMDAKDLIYEGIATYLARAGDFEFHADIDAKDLIYEGIATRL